MNKQLLTQTIFYFFFGLLIVNILYVLSGAIHFPLSHVDVIADWLYKAKYFYLYGLDLKLLSDWHGQYAHPQYPILVPVFFSVIFQLAGSVNVVAVSLLSSVVYIAILLLCYFFLRKKKYLALQAIIFTYGYSMVPPLMAQAGRYHAGMPDIYLTLLYWIAVWVVELSYARPRIQWVLVPLTIIASLIKLEGILLISCLILAPHGKLTKFFQLVMASVGLGGWQLIVSLNNIPSSYSVQLVTIDQLFYRISILLQEIVNELFLNLNNWYYIWWVLVLLLLSVRSKLSIVKKFLMPVMLLWVVGACLMYLLSSTPINGYASSSLDRLLLQSSPVWILIFFDRLGQLPAWGWMRTNVCLGLLKIFKLRQ